MVGKGGLVRDKKRRGGRRASGGDGGISAERGGAGAGGCAGLRPRLVLGEEGRVAAQQHVEDDAGGPEVDGGAVRLRAAAL